MNGLEFAYGGHPEDSSGVYTHEPTRPIPNVVVPVRTRIVMGVTHVSRADVDAIARELGSEFLGSEYHILRRNCNTFSDEFCKRLLGVGIPGFVNRLAFLAAQVECLLPMDRILGTVTVPVEQPSNDLEQ